MPLVRVSNGGSEFGSLELGTYAFVAKDAAASQMSVAPITLDTAYRTGGSNVYRTLIARVSGEQVKTIKSVRDNNYTNFVIIDFDKNIVMAGNNSGTTNYSCGDSKNIMIIQSGQSGYYNSTVTFMST